MQREEVTPRKDWQKKFNDLGFSFHSIDNGYWGEGTCYSFSADEIDHIEGVTEELYKMSLWAVEYVVSNKLYEKLGIPAWFTPYIEASWRKRDPSIYGRFDLSYDGRSEPKLLEFNADTPTSLIETSVAQWTWLEDVFPDADQFNSIHEKLITCFENIAKRMPQKKPFYFSSLGEYEEDTVTVEYIRDTALQGGLDARYIGISDIGCDERSGAFFDLDNNEIAYLFKLYPWEMLLKDDFGKQIIKDNTLFFEPAWKLILSNKAILPILWEIYPNHKNLLPASFEQPASGSYVKKPIFSREGNNISIHEKNVAVAEGVDGGYGAEGYIYQGTKLLPEFDGRYPVIGSWIIDNQPAGMGIREDTSAITSNTSKFVPHYFK